MLEPDDFLTDEELEREALDAETFYQDMLDIPQTQPTMEELADMAQQYDAEIPF